MNKGLRLDLSVGGRDGFESSMDATYRKEGLSVGSDHMVMQLLTFQFISNHKH